MPTLEENNTEIREHTNIHVNQDRDEKGFIRWQIIENLTPFPHGIMSDVHFSSEGNAFGDLEVSELEPTIPKEVSRTSKITYDRKKKHFIDESGSVVDSIDYLILHKDGSSTGGWRE